MSDEWSPPAGNDQSSNASTRTLLAAWILLALLLVYILIARYARPLWLGEEIGVDSSRVAEVEQRIDPNVAGWAELARLPGLGEAIARRIIAHRDEILAARSSQEASRPVFSSLEDLDAIRGIGPKTLEQIAPYLKFPDP